MLWKDKMTIKKAKNIFIRLMKFYGGLALIQLAVAAYLQIAMGSDSFTVFMQGVAKTFHLNVGLRVLVDAVYLVAGFLLGGVVGVGTVVCVVAIGPMVQFVMNHLIKQA